MDVELGGRHKRVVVSVGLLLAFVVIACLVWAQLRPHNDPYGIGTSHGYTLVHTDDGCQNPDAVRLGDHLWDTAGPGSRAHWRDWQFPVSGTFHIEASGRATFTADDGSSIPFKGGGKVSGLSCD